MKTFATTLALLLAAPLAACASAPEAATDDASAGAERAVDLPATVTLAPGESAIARAPELAVRFVAVAEDSRCPEDVTCVWAGRAVVELEVGDGEAPTVALEIGAGPRVGRGLALTAEALDPYPRSDSPTRAEDYRLRLRIERAAG